MKNIFSVILIIISSFLLVISTSLFTVLVSIEELRTSIKGDEGWVIAAPFLISIILLFLAKKLMNQNALFKKIYIITSLVFIGLLIINITSNLDAYKALLQ